MQLQAYIEPDHDQRRAEQERNAPAPGPELLVVQAHGQAEKQAVGGEKTDGGPQLREHAEPGALAWRSVLGGQQCRAAPFATQAQALAEAQQAQQDRGPGADAVVAWQHADQGGADAHQQQRGHQGRLAPDPVAEVAEQRRAQGAGQERDAEGQECREHLGRAGALGKEHRADHQGGGGGVDIEIVELDGGADEAGRGHPAGGVTGVVGGAGAVGRAGRHTVIPDSHCSSGANYYGRAPRDVGLVRAWLGMGATSNGRGGCGQDLAECG